TPSARGRCSGWRAPAPSAPPRAPSCASREDRGAPSCSSPARCCCGRRCPWPPPFGGCATPTSDASLGSNDPWRGRLPRPIAFSRRRAMATLLVAFLAVVSLWLTAFVVIQAVAAWRRWRGTRVITCPENRKPAAVDLDLGFAVSGAVLGRPELRLRDCSRWPE